MKSLSLLALAAVMVVGFVGAAVAADELTLTGTVACAKCTLKTEGATQCQDVLVVKGDNDEPTLYYITKNEVAEKFGHVCTGEKPAVVTGAVEDKDGKTWITPTTMAEKK
jgi:hypothetical protein